MATTIPWQGETYRIVIAPNHKCTTYELHTLEIATLETYEPNAMVTKFSWQ